MNTTHATWFDRSNASVTEVSAWCERIGLVAMAAMALTTLIDVIGSKVFHKPLPGSTEITGIIQVVTIAGGLAFSKIAGSQIRVDFIFDLLPEKGKAVLDLFGALLGLGFFVIASWMSFENGFTLYGSGTRTFLLGIPLYPFAFWIALCCLPMICILIVEMVTSFERML
jgi:TRAP-type C4-dicarboxylate transport system permease small subunit